MDDRITRQESISITPLPSLRPEAILKTEVRFPELDGFFSVRYVPDRYYLLPSVLENYLRLLPESIFEDPYETSYVILDDLNNQLVPKWLQVMARIKNNAALIEDRQPNWNNPALLSRQVIY